MNLYAKTRYNKKTIIYWHRKGELKNVVIIIISSGKYLLHFLFFSMRNIVNSSR